MTVGELRKRLEGVPDGAELSVVDPQDLERETGVRDAAYDDAGGFLVWMEDL
jgi:hypothetical protein